MNILNREIQINKKYIIVLLILNFLILGLYYTYAIFATKQIHENVAVLATNGNGITMTSNDLTNNSITVLAGATSTVTIDLNNTTGGVLYYNLLHTKVPTGVMVYETSNDGSSKANILSLATASVGVTIKNDTLNDITVGFYCQSSSTDSIDKEKGYSYINTTGNYDHSGANSPIMTSSNAIPVYYDVDTMAWKKADSTNSTSSADIWYDYDNQRWANIVFVGETNRTTYLDSPVGTTIEDEDILAFFVWIPKFRYRIVNATGVTNYERNIDVIFESSSLGSVTCENSISTDVSNHVYSEVCTDSVYGKIYNNLSTYSHPGSGTNNGGIWVGKFQTSSNGTRIIPNSSITTTSYTSASTYASAFAGNDNIYGISSFASGILNNMQWGALTILSNSLYGKSGNSVYFTDDNHTFKRIYSNVNANSISGCSSNYTISSNSFITSESSASCVAYNNLTDYTHTSNEVVYPIGQVGPGASTTGTVYGVYDMAGAEQEMVNGHIANFDGSNPTNSNSYSTIYSYNSFVGSINSVNNISNLYRYRLGDGIREHYRTFSDNGLWNGGYLKQSNTSGYIIRGGKYNSGLGSSIYSSDIVPYSSVSAFRVTLFVS